MNLGTFSAFDVFVIVSLAMVFQALISGKGNDDADT